MRRYVLLILGCLFFFGSVAGAATDSLLLKAGYPAADTQAVLTLYDSVYAIELTDPRRALRLYWKGIEWSDAIGYPNGAGKGFNYAGIVWFNLGEIDSAIVSAQRSLPYFERADNARGYAASLNNIGNAWNVQNDYTQAINYYQEANKIFESLGEEITIVSNLNNMGNLLIRSGNYDRAEDYLFEALDRAEAIRDTAGLADVNNNLGSLEENRANYEKALSYCRRSLAYYRQLGEVNFVIQAASNVGWCYHNLGDNDSALVHLEEALAMADNQDMPREKVNVLTNLSLVYNARKEYGKAVLSAKEALPAAREIGDLLFEKRLAEALVGAYEGLGDPAGAIPYYRRLRELSQQVYDTERNRQVLEMERKYESEKKERQILAQQLDLERSRARNRLMTVVSLLLILAGSLIILWLRHRIRLNKRLAAQQEELQAQRIREMEQQQQILAMDATLRGQEEERNRVARDLHDGLGGLLASVKMHMTALLRKGRDQEVFPLMQKTDRLIDQASGEVRRIAHNMTPAALMEDGLIAAIEEMAESLRRGKNIRVVVQEIGDPEELPRESEITLYRIVQELVQNIVKHAEATKVIIQLHFREDELNLLVEDDGCGFDAARSSNGLGLKSIASRVKYLNGELDIDSVPGEGTTVVITVPLRTQTDRGH